MILAYPQLIAKRFEFNKSNRAASQVDDAHVEDLEPFEEMEETRVA